MTEKLKLVVSDMHLSAGYHDAGNPLEDFASDRDFAAFLQEFAAESDATGADVELIFNGDTFEMLQVPHTDAFDPTREYEPRDYHSSSEEDSVRKMQIIVDGHPGFFGALAQFLRVGPPRRSVTFVKGNHDVDLHWLGVQACIREAAAATAGRAQLIQFEERYISREGIYVEHGNQYAESVNRLKDMDQPHDPDRPGQLALPLGSWFVMNVFNRVERQKYWIDGVKPITALIWYALAFDFPFAARAIATLIRALPGVLWQGLFESPAPSSTALADHLETPAKMEQLANRYEVDETFRAEFNAEVAKILVPASETWMEELPILAADADPLAMGDRIRAWVRSSLFEAAARCAAQERASLVTFGHTHDAGVEALPDGGNYINSGTWTWRADFGGEGKEAWRDLFFHPERFTDDRKLSYVRIDYDRDGQPTGQLCEFVPKSLLELPADEGTATEWWHRFLLWLRGILGIE
jgi:UDP-2,3-diacylglucosamine pyrophosphatase LpxH